LLFAEKRLKSFVGHVALLSSGQRFLSIGHRLAVPGKACGLCLLSFFGGFFFRKA
jgi:hypothetical protein